MSEYFEYSYAMFFLIFCGSFSMIWAIKEFTSYLKDFSLREAFYSLLCAAILTSIVKALFF
jgi:hypothetical protein|tara:strand:- start:1494 stop:1676 length:183 start_codon:yes stop_codon:yes gene_type:complete